MSFPSQVPRSVDDEHSSVSDLLRDDVFRDNGSRRNDCSGGNPDSWHQRCIDASLHIIAGYHAQLSEPAVFKLVPDFHANSSVIELDVCDYCAGSKVAAFSDDAVADIG